jgi:hypothetical protein
MRLSRSGRAHARALYRGALAREGSSCAAEGDARHLAERLSLDGEEPDSLLRLIRGAANGSRRLCAPKCSGGPALVRAEVETFEKFGRVLEQSSVGPQMRVSPMICARISLDDAGLARRQPGGMTKSRSRPKPHQSDQAPHAVGAIFEKRPHIAVEDGQPHDWRVAESGACRPDAALHSSPAARATMASGSGTTSWLGARRSRRHRPTSSNGLTTCRARAHLRSACTGTPAHRESVSRRPCLPGPQHAALVRTQSGAVVRCPGAAIRFGLTSN